jgi:SAM-dependent methyltransferase
MSPIRPLLLTSEASRRSECFLCGEASNTVIWRERGLEGLLCRCGMVYTNQAASAPSASPVGDIHTDEFYSLPAKLKARWMARRCPPGRLLEVGCGRGFFLAAARSHGYEVYGMEPSHAFDHELEALGIPVEHSFVETNCLPKHTFDVVFHCDLLAHFPDPIRSLEAMCELLTPGGVLCFEVGLLGGSSHLWYPLIGNIGLGEHLWLYSDEAFRNLMSRARLRLLHITYFGLAPEAIGGRIFSILNNRLLRPALDFAASDGKMQSLRLQASFVNFLRYRVGSLLPRVGPQTLMVVAQPEPR